VASPGSRVMVAREPRRGTAPEHRPGTWAPETRSQRGHSNHGVGSGTRTHAGLPESPALVAVEGSAMANLRNEADADRYARALGEAREPLISALTFVDGKRLRSDRRGVRPGF
jgi:hypothetical protein